MIIEIILVIIISGFYVFILLDTDQLKKENQRLKKEFNQIKEDVYKYILAKKADSEWEDDNANNS